MELRTRCRALQLQRALHDAVRAMFYMAGFSVLHLHLCTVMHTHTHTHRHATHTHTHTQTYAAHTNAICRLCIFQRGPLAREVYGGASFSACRLHTWKQAEMWAHVHVNTQTQLHVDMRVCSWTSLSRQSAERTFQKANTKFMMDGTVRCMQAHEQHVSLWRELKSVGENLTGLIHTAAEW